MPTPTSACKARTLVPKGDVLLTSRSRYAMPATSGHVDDPPTPQGERDALPVNTGWYAAPVMTGCDVDLGDANQEHLLLPQPTLSPSRTALSSTRLPLSESTSTVRRTHTSQPSLGPQQIGSIIKSQFGRKLGIKPDSFEEAIERQREEMPMPIIVAPSS